MTRRWRTGTRALLLRGGGAVLLLAGLGLSAITERGLLLHHLAAVRHGGDVVQAGSRGPQPGQHGSMVLVSGTPEVIQAPRDGDFNLSVDTPVLDRRVEMFQWREVHVGNDVHYELDWVDGLQDSTRFEQPRGHANPKAFPLHSERFVAGSVRVGGFSLGPVLIHALPGAEPVAPDPSRLPANLAASFSLYHDYLTTSVDPGSPRLGDVRVSWQAVTLQPVTIFARLDGDRLVRASKVDGQGYQVQVGERSLSDVLPDVPEPPESTTVRRAGAILLSALGAFLLLWERRRRVGDVALALAVGVTAIGAVSCASWLGGEWAPARNWMAVTAVGVLAVAVLHRRMARA
ncbi:TMEM43 family protein [Frateuria hangzhouensis]|uniref:TMEM43 family protein n=1 Tax=Frateuria hangzhouensis TaxID=2995589 RepID=UPI002260EDEC|nr:TMEM43 family protein [Frateuria sp. STR12]MCX7513115.1 TMEM43 family protein [Frateuria sp. STR12]